eukprot:711436-Prorocentrum_minimum.AAC.1
MISQITAQKTAAGRSEIDWALSIINYAADIGFLDFDSLSWLKCRFARTDLKSGRASERDRATSRKCIPSFPFAIHLR